MGPKTTPESHFGATSGRGVAALVGKGSWENRIYWRGVQACSVSTGGDSGDRFFEWEIRENRGKSGDMEGGPHVLGRGPAAGVQMGPKAHGNPQVLLFGVRTL